MFGRVRKWIGRGSIKMRLKTLKTYPDNVETVNGDLEFIAKGTQTVSYIRIKLIEKYIRGRGEHVQVDEYELGRWIYDEPLEVPSDEPYYLRFKLPFEFKKSNVDKLAASNFLGRGIANLAKSFKGIRSTYRLEAEAIVEGFTSSITDQRKISFGKIDFEKPDTAS
ncbi:MAG: hypothetical protein MK212_11270 [Saprospiraceae bacterium]|nr:hypothetical protein [Saprospiraceae bacterium]